MGTVNINQAFQVYKNINIRVCTLRGEKLNYKSVTKDIRKPPFFGS